MLKTRGPRHLDTHLGRPKPWVPRISGGQVQSNLSCAIKLTFLGPVIASRTSWTPLVYPHQPLDYQKG